MFPFELQPRWAMAEIVLSYSFLGFFPPLRRGKSENFPSPSLPWPDLPSPSLLWPLKHCPWILESQGSTRAHKVLAAVGMAYDLIVVILVGMTGQARLVQADCQGKGPIYSHFLQRLASVLHRWKQERLKKFIWRINPCILYFTGKVFLYQDYIFHKQLFC